MMRMLRWVIGNPNLENLPFSEKSVMPKKTTTTDQEVFVAPEIQKILESQQEKEKESARGRHLRTRFTPEDFEKRNPLIFERFFELLESIGLDKNLNEFLKAYGEWEKVNQARLEAKRKITEIAEQFGFEVKLK